MKARSERMLCGGKKVWFTSFTVDGVTFTSEPWHGKKGRDAARRVAALFSWAECAKQMLEHAADVLIEIPRMEYPECRMLYRDINKFVRKKP